MDRVKLGMILSFVQHSFNFLFPYHYPLSFYQVYTTHFLQEMKIEDAATKD